MTIGWSLLAIVGAALGVLIVVVSIRLLRERMRTAHRQSSRLESLGNTTTAHYGHS